MKHSKFAIGLLLVILATMPLTTGVSSFAFAPVVITTGVSLPVILAASYIGIVLIEIISKNYIIIDYKCNNKKSENYLILQLNI